MAFESVRFFRFRNLREQTVVLEAPTVFLIGANAQGKTNFLESIYLLCYGSSFRTFRTVRMIQRGFEESLVEGVFTDAEGSRRSVSVKLTAAKSNELRLDGSELAHRQELVGTNPCVVFSHGDMELVGGTPHRKRWFFNQTISLVDRDYMQTLRTYRKVLRSRNGALRAGMDRLLDVYDLQMAEMGWNLQQKRSALVEDFNVTFRPLFRKLLAGSEPDVTISYKPAWKHAGSCSDCRAMLAKRRERDCERGSTGSGPHRDGFSYVSGGRDFSLEASTGQVRLLSLALKAAQAAFFHSKTGRAPLLLLDDVLLELDGRKRSAFFGCLPACDQAFFTFLPEERFLQYATENTRFYSVENGVVSPWKKPVTS